jgi:hypothetical protein
MNPLTRYQKIQLLMLALGSLLILAGVTLFECNGAEPTVAATAFLLFGVAMLCAMVFSPEVR